MFKINLKIFHLKLNRYWFIVLIVRRRSLVKKCPIYTVNRNYKSNEIIIFLCYQNYHWLCTYLKKSTPSSWQSSRKKPFILFIFWNSQPSTIIDKILEFIHQNGSLLILEVYSYSFVLRSTTVLRFYKSYTCFWKKARFQVNVACNCYKAKYQF